MTTSELAFDPFSKKLDGLLDFTPRYEVQWDDCQRVAMQNVADWLHVPVRVLR